jgi:hypothetical protein
MEALLEWTHALLRAVRELVSWERVDADLIGMIGICALCFLWLVHLWRIRNRPEGRDHIARAVEVGDAIFGVLAAVAFLGLGLLIAVARTAGRAHDRRW